jgi:hypothetical protein
MRSLKAARSVVSPRIARQPARPASRYVVSFPAENGLCMYVVLTRIDVFRPHYGNAQARWMLPQKSPAKTLDLSLIRPALALDCLSAEVFAEKRSFNFTDLHLTDLYTSSKRVGVEISCTF